ncbi:ferric reductase-like transmembrane domain-containing protein [Wenzhouxiangella sp. XN24]|uniref:ferredoxin reductase family protein n=1 Tax=Wenzhouxiangella sp. XN24 TaxID=2713569 RepID=UPI0013EB5D8F|nr:ferric reductase-like transmembrane domain-containing protein [Wenzhouxiangella sp. XN24]NGX15134.1 hypothetical protein [Wenzhouxiangella sp. XN24]
MSDAGGAGDTTENRPAPQLRGLGPRALLILYVSIGLAPVLLALLDGEPFRNPWRELSAAIALAGFAWLLFEFVLSGRFRHVSGRVGIDVTMRLHQRAALVVLALLVIHPFLYAVPRLYPDPSRAMSLLQGMFTAGHYRSGVIAWLLLLALVAAARFRDRLPCRYETWRISHGVGAILVAGCGVHHALSIGRHSGQPALAAYWWLLTTVALLTLLFVYVVKPILQHARPYRVVSNRQVAARTWEVQIEAEHAHQTPFLAGQFAWLNLGHPPFSLVEHPFSISTAPADLPRIGFTIKQSGDFTDRIGTIPVGTRAWLDGPHGHFVLANRQTDRLAFIAGGVGLAPIMSMLRQLRADRWEAPLCLVYGNRAENQILYREELEAMSDMLDFRLSLVLSEPPPGWPGPRGQLSTAILDQCLARAERARWTYFVCGPPPMMDSVEQSLKAFGVPANRIVAERFRYD